MKKMLWAALVGLGLASSDAMAQSNPYAWQGPYPFGLTQTEIDGIIDHFHAMYSPAGTTPTVADRRFIKFQLSTGFACWKYDSLCDNFGPSRAGQFIGDYIQLLRRLPTKTEYAQAYGDLLTYYTNLASTSADYYTTEADHDLYVGAYQYFYGWGDDTIYPMPISFGGGGVEVNVGRARYLIGGHSWANAIAVPKDGVTVSLSATFNQEDLDIFGTPVPGPSVSKNGSKKNKVVVTGPFRSWFTNGITPALEFSILATGSAHGTTRTASMTGNLN